MLLDVCDGGWRGTTALYVCRSGTFLYYSCIHVNLYVTFFMIHTLDGVRVCMWDQAAL